jgi:spore coat protein U-like protein
MIRWTLIRSKRAASALLMAAFIPGAQAASCNLSIGNLNLGAYVGTQTSSQSNASFTCTNTNPALLPEKVDYEIRLSPGAGSFAQRHLVRIGIPADILLYNLYLNFLPAVLNTNVWGDGTGGTVFWSARMNLSPGQPSRTDTAILFGAIPAGVVPSAGNYQDTVVATVLIL